MNKFCLDHSWQRRTLDKRSDFRDACFWKSFKESGVSSCKIYTGGGQAVVLQQVDRVVRVVHDGMDDR